VTFFGFVAVGLGAALGAWVRWWLGITLNHLCPTLPLGTLAANLIGGYLIGLALGAMMNFEALAPELRLLLVTGFLGGLTTFSTFSAEAAVLLAREQYAWAAAHAAAHLAGSILATFAGVWTLRLFLR
jgi:CrcB protein